MWKHWLLIVGVVFGCKIAAAGETPVDIFDTTPKFKGAKVDSPIAARVLADKQYVLKMVTTLANESLPRPRQGSQLLAGG